MAGKKAKTGKIPAYQRIKHVLVGEVENRNPAPNTPFFSEKEIIERFGVSRVTVRQSLELMEQEGYIYRIQGKGTFIGSLETKPSKTVAFLSTCVMAEWTQTVLARAIEEYLNQQNYNLILCNTDDDFAKTERYLRRLLKNKIDAILYVCAASDSDYARNGQLLEWVESNDVPCVLVERTVALGGREPFSVTADNTQGAYAMTEHLISLGHTRIGFCATADNSVTRERMSGYLQCLSEHGLAINRDFLKKMQSLDENQVTALQYLRLEERPTAILAAHDQMAVKLMEALAGFNIRVPEDIAVAGFEDNPLTPLTPNTLTTVRVPLWEMGKLAASLVVDRLQGKALEPCQIRVPCELLIRESCGIKSVGRKRPAGVALGAEIHRVAG